ncbi:MAG: hypothetical protein SR3Q1_10495 [Quinella sp. 3Q1]|nr:hypothetical protein [Quinella sp. 3Q1]
MSKVLHGGEGVDTLNASSDKAQLYGLKGNDTLISDGKSDVLLVGGGGEDSLIVMGGEATLSGGDGSDVFEFTYSADKKVSAVIEDLEPSKDKIVVNFIGNTAPQLSSVASGNDVVWSDADGNFNLTLKSVRENDYFDGEASDEAWKVLELTNAEREAASLSPLTMSQGLMTGAQTRAEEIKILGESGALENHDRPDADGKPDPKKPYYTVPVDGNLTLQEKYHSYGENLDGGAVSPAEVVAQWMGSEKHKKNILDEEGKNFSKLGVGYVEDHYDSNEYYWTQLFADSVKSPEPISAANLSSAAMNSYTVSKSIAGDDNANTLENNFYGVTIDALGGNDSINNAGLNVSISGGADNDTIDSGGSFGTINAGKGNDQINLSDDAKEVLIQYKSGDGSDTISGLNSTDTLKILDDKYTPATVGNDIIVGVGNDSITLFGAASSGVQIAGRQSKLLLGTEDADNLSNSDDEATILAKGGNDTIDNIGSSVSIFSGAGDDYISNSGENVLFSYESGNDTINGFNATSTLQVAGGSYSSVKIGNDLILFGSSSTESIKILEASNLSSINIFDANDNPVEIGDAKNIVGTEQADSLINPVDSATIQAFGGDDTIDNKGARVSIYGGAGNDYVNNNEQRLTFYFYDSGDDTIEGFTCQDVLDIGTYAYETVESGADILVNIISNEATIGTVTLKDYPADQEPNIVSHRPSTSGENISNTASDTLITGTANSDNIDNTGTNVTINAFDSDDSVTNGTVGSSSFGSNSIIYGNGGNDFIGNYGDNATLVGDAGNDIIINSGKNVSMNGGAGNDYLNTSYSDNSTIDGGDGADQITNSYSSATIISGAGDDYILNTGGDNSSINSGTGNDTIINTGNSVTIDGGGGDDRISNAGASALVNGNAGNDTIHNDSADASNVTISGGDGNDVISNLGSNVSINGGAGDDRITTGLPKGSVVIGYELEDRNSFAKYVSILGGKGNDQIRLVSDSENFIRYAAGDGNDTIWGISATDSISIAGGKYTRRFDRNDVIYEVGEGSITLKDGRNKPLPIIIGESGTSGSGSGGGNSGGSGGGSSSGNGGGSSGQSGGNTSGGTSASEGRGSDASGGLSATAGVSASNNSGGSSSSGRIHRTITSFASTTPTASPTPSTVSAQLNADASQPSASSSATPKITLNAPTYANNPSGEDVVAAIQSGNEAFKKHWGTEGNDTLYGGEGVDVFISGKNQGSDTFLNVSAEDIVYLNDVTLNDLMGIKKTGDTVSISLKTGNTMTIQSSDTVSGAIVFADTTWHFTHNTQP